MHSGPSYSPESVEAALSRRSIWKSWLFRLLLLLLLASIGLNLWMLGSYQEYYSNVEPPLERFRSGDRLATQRIAVIEVKGTIMPPFTARILKSIKRAQEDENVHGVLLVVDSPGGLVADSHQIYHALRELNAVMPVYVSMKRMAASGGYYIAMGAGLDGKIFAEPTTWTGSIGVIIPRWDFSELAARYGVQSAPLKTGPFKDALNPLKELSAEEEAVWNAILADAFDRFLGVISENRSNLNPEAVRDLATGQVYTATQALELSLIDQIGFEEDALAALQEHLGLEKVRVVTYDHPVGLSELLLGQATSSAPSPSPAGIWRELLETTVPRAMYYCSGMPGLLSEAGR